MIGQSTLIFLIMAIAVNTDQDMMNTTESTNWTISTTKTPTSTESSPSTERMTLTEAATSTTTPATTTSTAKERNVTHATTPKAVEDSHHAPPWVIVLITFCFIHLVGGVVFAMVTKYKKGQLYIFARLRKRDSIMPAGPPAAGDKKSTQPVEPAPLPGESAPSVKNLSEGAATAKTTDAMQGMPGIPGEGKAATPSAAKNVGNGVGKVDNLNKSQTKMSTVKKM